jgi:23S rRNA (uridine2552-2'-O)-methyltransferase
MAHKPFQRKDRFYKKAKKEGYVARSAYKIIELHERYKIFRPKNRVVDLGCAPGGWFQVGQEKLNEGKMIGIDLLPLKISVQKRNAFIQGDFTDEKNQEEIKEFIGNEVDWVISDMSPDISGIKFKDEYLSFELCNTALNFAMQVLKPGGGFLCKIFPSSELDILKKDLKSKFEKIKIDIPEATRKSSSEIYLIGLNKKSEIS